jgi:hypothetical protein
VNFDEGTRWGRTSGVNILRNHVTEGSTQLSPTANVKSSLLCSERCGERLIGMWQRQTSEPMELKVSMRTLAPADRSRTRGAFAVGFQRAGARHKRKSMLAFTRVLVGRASIPDQNTFGVRNASIPSPSSLSRSHLQAWSFALPEVQPLVLERRRWLPTLSSNHRVGVSSDLFEELFGSARVVVHAPH